MAGGPTNPYSPEANALFARMSVQPDATRRAAINTCILALISAGVWNKLYALYLTAAHDEQAAQLNWIGPTLNLLKTGTVTFTANQDYVPNGVDGYLDTQFAPNLAGQDSFAMGLFLRTNAQAAAPVMGTGTGSGMSLLPRSTTDTSTYRVNTLTNGSVASQTNSSGLTVADRSASNLTTLYRGGASVGTTSNASAAPSAASINIGRFSGNFATITCQGALLSQSLSAGEHTALYNALNTYIAGL